MTLVRFVLLALLAVAAAAPVTHTGGALRPPVIREPFTTQLCPASARTTRAMVACAEKAILRTDRAINALVKTIFGVLPPARRKSFVESEKAWLRYRRSSCVAQVSLYVGGSIYPVEYGYCEVARNRTHLKDLAALRCGLRPQDAMPKSCMVAKRR